MIYECAYCHKLYDEEDGMMILEDEFAVLGTRSIYVFKCKNCMSKGTQKKFEEFKNEK